MLSKLKQGLSVSMLAWHKDSHDMQQPKNSTPTERTVMERVIGTFGSVSRSPRITGSRELFWGLRILGINPIIWSEDEFTVSGSPAVCIIYAVALGGIVSTLLKLSHPEANWSQYQRSRNPIQSNMDSLLSIISVSGAVMTSFHVIVFLRCRKRIANAFNELQKFWSS